MPVYDSAHYYILTEHTEVHVITTMGNAIYNTVDQTLKSNRYCWLLWCSHLSVCSCSGLVQQSCIVASTTGDSGTLM